jgi:uncharacterized protein YlaI
MSTQFLTVENLASNSTFFQRLPLTVPLCNNLQKRVSRLKVTRVTSGHYSF